MNTSMLLRTPMIIVIFDSLAISHKSVLVQVVLPGMPPKTELFVLKLSIML